MFRSVVGAVAAAIAAVAVAPTAVADNFETQSGRVLCAVTPDSTLALIGPSGVLSQPANPPYDAAVCQGDLTQTGYGHSIVTTGNGYAYSGGAANIAVYNTTTKMVYGNTYQHGVWSIYNDQNGTRLTNTRTGHGMFVSVERAYAF